MYYTVYVLYSFVKHVQNTDRMPHVAGERQNRKGRDMEANQHMTLVYTRFNNCCEIHTHAQENSNNIIDASMNA